MSTRVVEGLAGLGVLASAGILVAMLAAPLIAPAAIPGPTATPGATISAEPSADAAVQPVGQFLRRGRFGADGHCLGVELRPESYPVARGATGTATVWWWTSSIVDPGDPAVCTNRIGELGETQAIVTTVAPEDDPEGPPVGYLLEFHLPSEFGESDMAIVILAARSTDELLQAIDIRTSGQGHVLERVASIDPPLAPAPSVNPPTTGQLGLFLLRSPLGPDLPCLVIELDVASYPTDRDAVGVAQVRWWEPADRDPANPFGCLGRSGDVGETGASVFTIRTEACPPCAPLSYLVAFTTDATGIGTAQNVQLSIPAEQPSPDEMTATALVPAGLPPLAFDRVDAIDPPLVPPPSGSPAP